VEFITNNGALPCNFEDSHQPRFWVLESIIKVRLQVVMLVLCLWAAAWPTTQIAAAAATSSCGLHAPCLAVHFFSRLVYAAVSFVTFSVFLMILLLLLLLLCLLLLQEAGHDDRHRSSMSFVGSCVSQLQPAAAAAASMCPPCSLPARHRLYIPLPRWFVYMCCSNPTDVAAAAAAVALPVTAAGGRA
jgi:hypothetical protein